MIGNAEAEFESSIEAVGIALIRLPLGVPSEADTHSAGVKKLRFVGAVRVALEADFVFIRGLRKERSSESLAVHSGNGAADEGRLSRRRIRVMRVVAVRAFRMARSSGACLWKRRSR